MKNIGIIGGGLIGSSWAAIFSKSGFAQLPTPIAIFAFGNDFLKPWSRGVTTSTSPRSLFLRTNILLGILVSFVWLKS